MSPSLFNLYAEYIIRNAGLEEAQAGIKIVGRNINNLRYVDAAAAKSLQSCPTPSDPMDCSLAGSSVHGICQATVLDIWLLLFLPAILIPACASSSPAFLMMYSAQKLNKQDDNIQPWRTPFPIWNKSVVPCPVLTVAS